MEQTASFLAGFVSLCVVVACTAAVGYSLAVRWFRDASVTSRWTAAFVLGCWLAALQFAILATVGAFSRGGTALLAIISALPLLRKGVRSQEALGCLASDLRVAYRAVLRADAGPAWKVTLTVFVFSAALLGIRALCLPLLGWDTLTYHGVKSGLWVQSKGWFFLDAPGGWEYYRSFFGGGEVFTAWGMVFFHSDLLAGMPDMVFWLFLGLVIVSLGRELGLGGMPSGVLAMVFLCSFDVSRMVGSGYVELCSTALLLAGLLFLVRFGRGARREELYLAAAAFGLSASVKVNMLAAVLASTVLWALLLWRQLRLSWRWLGVAIPIFLAPIVPWLLFNLTATGYPLGSTPVEVGGLKMGVAPPNLLWLLEEPEHVPYVFATEVQALRKALNPFGHTLIFPLLGFFGVFLGGMQKRREALLAIILISTLGAFYFSPGFSVVRLDWAPVNGRFLLPILVLAAVAGLATLAERREIGPMGLMVAAILMLEGIDRYLRMFVFDMHAMEVVFVACAVLVTLGVWRAAALVIPVSTRRRALAAMAVGGVALMILAAAAYTKDAFRNTSYAVSVVYHLVPSYWTDALAAVEADPAHATIAFTYGSTKVSHGAFLAPFLGGDLSRRILYVTPERDGSIIPHHPSYDTTSNPDFARWVERLRAAGATHLLCFRPAGVELRWADANPELFTRLAGREDDWGFFRLMKEAR